MSLTARDRKILAVLVVLATLAAYWLVLLGPKREEARQAGEKLTEQVERRDAALAELEQLESAKDGFRNDYATVVRLGKAIPTEVDMPALMMQLQEAARGTGIGFDSIATGERTAAPAATTAAPPTGDTAAAPATGDPAAPAAPAPAPAASGQSAEEAGESAQAASTAAPAASAATAAPTAAAPSTGTATSTGTTATATDATGTTATAAPGLESVPLEFTFTGSFFELADFFHEMKRFVHVANDRIEVRGRLMTLDSVSLTSEEGAFPNLTAEISATVYVAPETQGTTAGATPEGPAPVTPPATEAVPATAGEPAPAPPTATATP